MGDRLQAGEPFCHPGQLNLTITSWIGAMNTIAAKKGVKGHSVRCTSTESVIWLGKVVPGKRNADHRRPVDNMALGGLYFTMHTEPVPHTL